MQNRNDYIGELIAGNKELAPIHKELVHAVELILQGGLQGPDLQQRRQNCGQRAYRRQITQKVHEKRPLTHIISFQIAFAFFAIVEILDVICCNDLISGSFIYPVTDVVILVVLILVSHGRTSHYSHHRTEQMFDFLIAKEYTEIEKGNRSV